MATATATRKPARNSRRITDVTQPALPVKITDKVTAPAVSVLESAWAAIRRQEPDLPAVAFAIGAGGQTRGHFQANAWAEAHGGEYTRPEIFMAGERLKDGPEAVLATLLHEAAHALAHVRGIQDTSRQGRFHNTRYRDVARSLGLVVAQVGTIGWSDTTLAPETVVRYRVTLAKLATITAHRRANTRAEATGRKSNNNGISAECPTCERKVRMSKGGHELGPVLCQPCLINWVSDMEVDPEDLLEALQDPDAMAPFTFAAQDTED